MKLATLDNGTRDGRLVIVSKDLKQAVSAEPVAANLQQALDGWEKIEPRLREMAAVLDKGGAKNSFAFDPAVARPPLPRAYQFFDASVYRSHLELMARAFDFDPAAHVNAPNPMMGRRGSDSLIGACEDVPLVSEQDGIDFEAEIGVIIDDVPMGAKAAHLSKAIKLIVLFNDVSLRIPGFREFREGFGLVHAKPLASFSPVAVTPDELGDAWRDGCIHLPITVTWNDKPFGHPNAGQVMFTFEQLIEYAARTRPLCAGTIIGSGTVSNKEYLQVGSACITERRAIEKIQHGAPQTEFMRFGDRVRIEMFDPTGSSIFGAINQKMVRHTS